MRPASHSAVTKDSDALGSCIVQFFNLIKINSSELSADGSRRSGREAADKGRAAPCRHPAHRTHPNTPRHLPTDDRARPRSCDTASRLTDIAHSQRRVHTAVEVHDVAPHLVGSRHTVPVLRQASKVRAWTLR